MIQDTDQAILDLVWRGSQITGQVVKDMIRQYAARRPKSDLKHGEQNLDDLNRQGKKLEEVVIIDEGIMDVKRRLKAYAVDFSIMRDPDTQENHVFFKAQDYERVKAGLTQVAADLMKDQKGHDRSKPDQTHGRPEKPMEERIQDAEAEAKRRQAERANPLHEHEHDQNRERER